MSDQYLDYEGLKLYTILFKEYLGGTDSLSSEEIEYLCQKGVFDTRITESQSNDWLLIKIA